MLILIAEDITNKINDGAELIINFTSGEIFNKIQNRAIIAKPFSNSQLEIYKRGGLLKRQSKVFNLNSKIYNIISHISSI